MKLFIICMTIVLNCGNYLSAKAKPEKEYYCYSKKSDMYAPAYEGDKDECENDGEGKFVINAGKKLGWSCRYSDSIFYIGKKSNKKQAEEVCVSGKLKRL